MNERITNLLKNLCCSVCKNDISEKDIKFIYTEGNYNVINITCKNCGKDFGTVFLKIND